MAADVLPPTHPLLSATAQAPLVLAARRAPGPRVPVWFMRQAGRSLPEYRRLREGTAMLDACFDSDMLVEITLQPVRRHGVDAAILFSDIVVPLRAVGVPVDIVAGTGPVLERPIRTRADLEVLRPLEPDDVAPILVGVRELASQLGSTPLIGFAGAPFTLASYLVEGGPSRDLARTKALMYGDPALWHDLAERLAHIAGAFLRQQVLAGASAVQLFDSWVGALPAEDYRTFILPHSRTALSYVEDLPVPRIHFGVGSGELLPSMASAFDPAAAGGTPGASEEPADRADVMGVDFRLGLDEANDRLGNRFALQGNLDPALLGAPWPVVAARVDAALLAGRSAPGHIFNLGHGVLPGTDPDVLTRIVERVHETTDA